MEGNDDNWKLPNFRGISFFWGQNIANWWTAIWNITNRDKWALGKLDGDK